MCGIAGLVDFKFAPEPSVLRAMEQAMIHRGPDEGAVWASGAAGLAHRRLRIIDLSPAAAQPMQNEDGRVRVVFNGEIYNFHELRDELLKLGHTFRSRSDTEVLVHGYESWGPDLVKRLRGMFAFALWDEEQQRLLLARDRIGKKPLYYGTCGSRFAFGSELNQFKAVANWPLRLSAVGFKQYVEYGYVLSPGSILEGIQRLPAGHYAVVDRTGLQVRRYWSLPTSPDRPRLEGGTGAAAEALEPVLRDAVKCRLESDVPLGCFLSGGVDSSLVAALAQECLDRPLKTYTVGFEDPAYSEAAYARQVAKLLGTDHHEINVSPRSVLEQFEEILSHAAEPLGDDSYIPTYLVSRETRRFVTVALSGDGGDELFGGYTKYHQWLSARRFQRWPVPWRSVAALAWNDRLFKSADALATGEEMELARWLSSLWKRDELSELLVTSPAVAADADLFDEGWVARGDYPATERWMMTDMETNLEGGILPKVDRASMAVSLEARSPFLDARFVDETLRWTARAELPLGGKRILKTMLAKRLPIDLFERPKQGFDMPLEHWFRGELRGVLQRYTDPARLRRRGLLRAETVGRSVREHLSGRRNFARKLYAIVAFEIWADRFFGSDTTLA
jgi:asparagine synthase (glutamine-hydrolysing)